MSVLTISRQDSCRGDEVAAEVARHLGCRLVDRALMKELIYSYDLLSCLGKLEGGEGEGGDPDDERIREITEGIIYHLSFQENLVLLGHGGQFLFRGCPSVFHVRIQASLPHRVGNFPAGERGKPESVLQRREQQRRRLVRRAFGADLTSPEHYDLVLKMDTLGVHGAVKTVLASLEGLPWREDGDFESIRSYGRDRGVREVLLEPLPAIVQGEASFAHPSEAEFARVLDFYRIRWEYEPTSFPIEWWPDGRVKESFTPDFFLPDLGTYLELTTMKQALVTKKNRKVRRFRELYPERKLNIFYGRDYRRLALKYGLE